MHCNARLSMFSRKLLVKRHLAGEKVSIIARQLGVSRKCCYEWIARYKKEGEAGLVDKKSGPKISPRRISKKKEAKILSVRKKYKEGPDRIALRLNMSRSTTYKVLKRNGMNHLFEKKEKKHTKRYEKKTPGERLQLDIKHIPALGGKGFRYQVSVIDDCTRYVRAKVFERKTTRNISSFVTNCLREFPFRVKEIATDNGMEFTMRYSLYKNRKTFFQKELERLGIKHTLIKPRTPQLNGKVERFHRTVDDELYKVKRFINEKHRERELKRFLKRYNTKRYHLGIKGMTPEQKLNIFLDEKCYQVS